MSHNRPKFGVYEDVKDVPKENAPKFVLTGEQEIFSAGDDGDLTLNLPKKKGGKGIIGGLGDGKTVTLNFGDASSSDEEPEYASANPIDPNDPASDEKPVFSPTYHSNPNDSASDEEPEFAQSTKPVNYESASDEEPDVTANNVLKNLFGMDLSQFMGGNPSTFRKTVVVNNDSTSRINSIGDNTPSNAAPSTQASATKYVIMNNEGIIGKIGDGGSSVININKDTKPEEKREIISNTETSIHLTQTRKGRTYELVIEKSPEMLKAEDASKNATRFGDRKRGEINFEKLLKEEIKKAIKKIREEEKRSAKATSYYSQTGTSSNFWTTSGSVYSREKPQPAPQSSHRPGGPK